MPVWPRGQGRARHVSQALPRAGSRGCSRAHGGFGTVGCIRSSLILVGLRRCRWREPGSSAWLGDLRWRVRFLQLGGVAWLSRRLGLGPEPWQVGGGGTLRGAAVVDHAARVAQVTQDINLVRRQGWGLLPGGRRLLPQELRGWLGRGIPLVVRRCESE